MFPIWVNVAIALAIALVAFGLCQFKPGLGVAFVALASTAWTAFAVYRGLTAASRD